MLAEEVLYSHGNTLHLYPLACPLYTVEVSTLKRNRLLDAFFLVDQGIIEMYLFDQYLFILSFYQVNHLIVLTRDWYSSSLCKAII